MTANEIPLLQVRGTHHEVGLEIGRRMKPTLEKMLSRWRAEAEAGWSWSAMVGMTRPYLDAARQAFPQYVEEIEGIAEGAGLAFAELFVGVCEELWSPAASRVAHGGGPYGAAPEMTAGCTDMAARGRATVDGTTLLAHNNDLPADAEETLVLLQVQAGNDPELLSVSPGGMVYSAGFNAAGISLTGNYLAPNDARPGVPRTIVARAVLGARRLEEVLEICLCPTRASSYNNIVADAHGEVYSMEGSATDCEPIYIVDDVLAHANHYVSARMRHFEHDPTGIGGSIYRQHRALRLLRENYGLHSPELFRRLLADHANYPVSICKHGQTSVTVFSIIIELETRRAWIGRGRACQTAYREYELEPSG